MNATYEIRGSGAIGNVLFEEIRRLNLPVSMKSRSGQREDFTPSHLEKKPNKKAGVIFITTKAYDVLTALSDIESDLEDPRSSPSIIILANGLPGNVSLKARKLYPHRTIRPGFVTFGSSYSAEQKKYLRQSTGGCLGFGRIVEFDPEFREEELMLAQLNKGFFKIIHKPEDLSFYLNRKWLFNVSLNLLCGGLALNSNEGALAHETELHTLFLEGWTLGIHLNGPWQESIEATWSQLKDLIKDTGRNQNSMQRDLVAGRKTEIAELLPEDFTKIASDFPTISKFRQKILMRGVAPEL